MSHKNNSEELHKLKLEKDWLKKLLEDEYQPNRLKSELEKIEEKIKKLESGIH